MGKEIQIKYIPLDELKAYENNPRNNEEAVPFVANSIREFGFKNPVIIDADNVIVAGHTRVKAAKSLGMKEVPCIVADDLTPEQIKAFRLADNKTAEIATWDIGALDEELHQILDINMLDFGFDINDLPSGTEDVGGQDNEYNNVEPPAEEDTITKPGDLWILGRHRLLCGDSTKMDDVKRLMGDEKASLLITDPPYNVALGMGGSKDEARKRHRRTDGLVIANDRMEDEDFEEFLTRAFTAAKNVMDEGAGFYIWHASQKTYEFISALRLAGMVLRQILIWNKNTFTLGRQDYQWKHEPCLYGWTDGTHHWYGDRKQATVIDMPRPTKSEDHPTMKPVGLFAYQIKNSSKAGDIVLDLFGGSGTTILACEKLGRYGRLMEIDPRYCDVIVRRWEEETGEKAHRE